MHAGHHNQPLHGAHRQRAKAPHDAPVSSLCGETPRFLHPRGQRQRLHLAHHRQRQDPYLLQSLHLAQGQSRYREMPLRRGSQGFRPPDPRGVQQISGRLRRGKYQHRRPCPPPAFRGLCGQGDRHHHPEARTCAGRNEQAQQAAEKKRPAHLQGAARALIEKTHRLHLR